MTFLLYLRQLFGKKQGTFMPASRNTGAAGKKRQREKAKGWGGREAPERTPSWHAGRQLNN